ncbi:MAG TPA: glycosyltransferase family 4 protein [Candidatus Krumholzibacteriaceae bacterium]|nr:glycosyltransferase family 4 protein [Candidatus Krumholzibacteriaceae bacterium]
MNEPVKLKIAMIGSKGIPALFGGIERHVEEISVRLVQKGHDVTVYGRKSFSTNEKYKNVDVRIMPSLQTKNFDTATSSFLSTISAISDNFDIIHYHGIGPSIFCFLGRLGKSRIFSTIHAQDYRQVKWGRIASRMLKFGEKEAVLRSDTAIAVSKLLSKKLMKKYKEKVNYIPNGANTYKSGDFPLNNEFGLESDGYILAAGRFIVEKGYHTLIDAFSRINTDKKLVIVGDKTGKDEYTRSLLKRSDSRIVFTGFMSGAKLNRLYSNCYFYVLPSLVEGLPISLIEAMGFARPVLVSDIPENLEVVEDMGVTFKSGDQEDLKVKLEKVLKFEESRRKEIGERCLQKVSNFYNWDLITDQLENVYLETTK